MRKELCLALLVVGASLSGCTAKRVVELDIPDEVKAVFDRTAPQPEFVFYAQRAAPPRTWEEFSSTSLHICEGSPAFTPEEIRMAAHITIGITLEGCVNSAVADMTKKPGTILLTRRDAKFKQRRDMVEVVFR